MMEMSGGMPLISVVVPVYNSDSTVSECIESIVGQSLTDIEIVLVDDGSSDRSGQICDEYALKDHRIKVIHQANKGRTEGRAAGTRMAQGEWICYVDSDDRMPKDALNDLYSSASDQVDIVLGNAYTLPGCHETLMPMSQFRHLAVRGEGTIGLPWGSLYRRSVITDYLFDLPREIMMGEDYIFWLRLCFQTEKPVSLLYKNTYLKGADSTCNSFVWTSDYCYRINELRKSSIPSELHDEFMKDMIEDRICNLFTVTVCQPRSEWTLHPFYQEIQRDIQAYGYKLPLKKRIFLSLPGRRLCVLYSKVSNLISRVNGVLRKRR